jgi:protein involved in polysaccharide export with SLBB domain
MNSFSDRAAAIGLLVITSCSGNTPPAEVNVEPTPIQAHALGAGDVVEIKVFREPDLQGLYRVEASGSISFPLIGEVRLLGRKPVEVEHEVRDRLADGYLIDPQVNVFVRESKSQRIHVIGQVNKPGTFPYEMGMSIIEAITTAGGFTGLASPNGVTVTRAEGQKLTFEARVGDIRAGEAPNIELKPGDIIYVPEAVF